MVSHTSMRANVILNQFADFCLIFLFKCKSVTITLQYAVNTLDLLTAFLIIFRNRQYRDVPIKIK